MADNVLIYGRNGVVLSLPYPQEYDLVVNLSEVLKDFPDIRSNAKALEYLFEYKHIRVTREDMSELLFTTSPDVLALLTKNPKFNEYRSGFKPEMPVNLLFRDLLSSFESSFRR